MWRAGSSTRLLQGHQLPQGAIVSALMRGLVAQVEREGFGVFNRVGLQIDGALGESVALGHVSDQKALGARCGLNDHRVPGQDGAVAAKRNEVNGPHTSSGARRASFSVSRDPASANGTQRIPSLTLGVPCWSFHTGSDVCGSVPIICLNSSHLGRAPRQRMPKPEALESARLRESSGGYIDIPDVNPVRP
jgi:hypothetical protein